MQDMSKLRKIHILIGVFILSTLGLLFIPAIPQDLNYHNFADTRPLLGLANFGDTYSNIGFLIVGIWGIHVTVKKGSLLSGRLMKIPFLVFFIGVTLVCFGSGYYHDGPNSERLLWDRLPMTIAFMALFTAFIADRISLKAGVLYCLPILLILGFASLIYWVYSESLGQGDLRFYGLVQFYPMIAIPLICYLFPKNKYTGGGYLIWIIFWYAMAKILEHFDAEVFALLGETISGHSLKHIAASLATYMALKMMLRVDISNVKQGS